MEGIRDQVERVLDPREGACGIAHATLEVLSWSGYVVECLEERLGVRAHLIGPDGSVIEGRDVTWAPAILESLIKSGVYPEGWEERLSEVLTPERDMRRLARVFGYGRVLTVDRVAARIVLGGGGTVIVRRRGLGSEVEIRYDGSKSDYVSYCPACALALAAVRHPRVYRELKRELADVPNTGKVKAEDGVVNSVRVRRGIAFATLKLTNRSITNRGCCVAYAIVRAELKAGYGSERSKRLLRAYCDECPLKHCWVGKPIGALGNVVLQRLTETEGGVRLRVEEYPEVVTPAGTGKGTLCALSACANAVLRLDASKVLKPDPSRSEAWGDDR
ncbi:hypothetical protein [Methanopyrus kandleri]